MQKRKTDNVTRPGSSKRKKIALGRGLDSLIPDFDSLRDSPKEYFLCELDRIRPNRFQPRRHFPKDELQELSLSIKEHGIVQPLLVRKTDLGFELIAGERRLRAAKMAGLSQVPVIQKDISDKDVLEVSIVENIQREGLNPLEEAEAYHFLLTEFDLTQDETAKRVGKSRSSVANMLRLLQLPSQIKDSIMDGNLSMGHARALLGIESPVQQKAVHRTVIAKRLSVRQTENLVKRLRKGKKKINQPASSAKDIYLLGLSEELSRQFGTKVQIKRRGQRGKVEIEFYTDDDLDRLLALLK